MKKSLLTVIKENKKVIIKKSLIVGGTLIGLFVVDALLSPSDAEDIDVLEGLDVDGDMIIEVEDCEEMETSEE